MIRCFSHLPSKIYSYLLANKHRLVPFEELCGFAEPLLLQWQLSNEKFASPVRHQSLVLEILVFLSDIGLITLNQLTDQSTLNFHSRN